MQPDANDLNKLQQELPGVASDPQKMADLAAALVNVLCAKQDATAARMLAGAKEDIGTLLATANAYTKTLIDVMKHLTTLATGVAVLIATFHEKFATAMYFRWVIPVAFVSLLVSIAYALKICMLALRQEGRRALVHTRFITFSLEQLGIKNPSKAPIPDMTTSAEKDDQAVRFASVIANVAFFVALCALGAFVLANK